MFLSVLQLQKLGTSPQCCCSAAAVNTMSLPLKGGGRIGSDANRHAKTLLFIDMPLFTTTKEFLMRF